jgi:uncharacterized membrane protein YdfJ with MMPL/SSD domain
MPLSQADVAGARGGCDCARCRRLLEARCLSLKDYVTGMGVIRVMDCGVLLLSRIQQEYRRWPPDNARAVSAGLRHTGGLITAAAAIMAAVFVSFALADLVVIKAICIGMGVAVVVDATVVLTWRTP